MSAAEPALFQALTVEECVWQLVDARFKARGLEGSSEDRAAVEAAGDTIRAIAKGKDTSKAYDKVASAVVRRVYEWWLEVSGKKPTDCRLTERRRKLIRKNVLHFGESDLMLGMRESHNSDWHRTHQQSGIGGKWFRSIDGVERMIQRAKEGRMQTGGEQWV